MRDNSLSVYKYFTQEKYATALLEQGEFLFRSLSYFRELEDSYVRGDQHDGKLRYRPDSGLQITKEDGSTLELKGWSFVSSVKQEAIFVQCFSRKLSKKTAELFESPFCVEIFDPTEIIDRLKARKSSVSKLDYELIHSGTVEYRPLDVEPKADWALPEKLAFLKPEQFVDQDEFRIVFGRRGAFDVENVELSLKKDEDNGSEEKSDSDEFKLRLGSFEDCAKFHRF